MGGRRERAILLADVIDELDHLAETVEIQQVSGNGWGVKSRGCRVVGPTHRNRGMETAGESDDEIGISASANANHLDLLTTERMIRMSDGHQSRRWLG